MYRICKQCGEAKVLDAFPKYRAKGKHGWRHVCRRCWNARWSSVVVEHCKRYYHENTNGYRDRAKARTACQHEQNSQGHYRRNAEYRKRHPDREAAKVAVMIALRAGSLILEACERIIARCWK